MRRWYGHEFLREKYYDTGKIKRYANHVIDKSSTISYLDSKFSGLHHEQIADDFKDAMALVPAEEAPPVEAQEMEQSACKGVTLGYVRGLQTFITDRTEKRERESLVSSIQCVTGLQLELS
jgi:hypothetical protein